MFQRRCLGSPQGFRCAAAVVLSAALWHFSLQSPPTFCLSARASQPPAGSQLLSRGGSSPHITDEELGLQVSL